MMLIYDAWKISRDDGAVLAELLRRPLKPIENSAICSRPDLVALESAPKEMKTYPHSGRTFLAAREIVRSALSSMADHAFERGPGHVIDGSALRAASR
jgi:hypothetical protein